MDSKNVLITTIFTFFWTFSYCSNVDNLVSSWQLVDFNSFLSDSSCMQLDANIFGGGDLIYPKQPHSVLVTSAHPIMVSVGFEYVLLFY